MTPEHLIAILESRCQTLSAMLKRARDELLDAQRRLAESRTKESKLLEHHNL